MRRLRANISLSYRAEDSTDETEVKTTPEVSTTTSFGAHCVRNVSYADIESSNTSKLQEMSDWDQSDDLELLQSNYYRAPRILRFQSKQFMDPQRSIFNWFRRTRALYPSQTLYPTVVEGHGQSEIDKNRLSRSSRVRDLARTHLWVITRSTLQTKLQSERTLEASITTILPRVVSGRSLVLI